MSPTARRKNIRGPEHDERENLRGELSRLHKAMLRLAFHHAGEDAGLDRQLNQLKETLRSGDKQQLTRLIEDIVSVIVKRPPADAAVSATATNSPGAASAFLADLLNQTRDRLPSVSPFREPLKALIQEAGDPDLTGAQDGVDRLLDIGRRAFDECLKARAPEPAPDAQVPSVGVVDPDLIEITALRNAAQRMFGGFSPAVLESAGLSDVKRRLRRLNRQADMLAALEEAAKKLSAAYSATQANTAAVGAPATGKSIPPDGDDALHSARLALLKFLSRTQLPAELKASVDAVRERLQAASHADDIQAAGVTLADLVHEANRALRVEVTELSGFLKQVMSKLQELRGHLTDTGDAQDNALKDSEALGVSVGQRMDRVSDCVDQAADLQTLKVTIAEDLARIRLDVESFVSQERSRHADTSARLSTMTAQVRGLTAEADTLRERIRAERERATHDPLTGLANRLGLDEYMTGVYGLWRRNGDALSVIVFDIDRFKSVNDRWGHTAGDRVLKTVAAQLREQMRSGDFLARFGGEEFVMILPKTDLDQGARLAEKFRQHIDSCEFHHGPEPVPVTISCGVATFHTGETPGAVFDRADQALYQAKREGRNRCVMETSPR
jgi:diguanylate cyclase